MDTSIIHRCADPGCCSFGRPSSQSCGCHKDGIQVLTEQRDALLAALKDARPHIGVGYSGIQRHGIMTQVDAALAMVEGRAA